MKKLYLLLAICIPFITWAQSNRKKTVTDSVAYFQSAMHALWKANNDSFRCSAPYVEAYNKYQSFVKKSKNYSAFVMFFDIFHADYKQFNTLLAQDGLPEMSNAGLRFGFGSSHRTNRGMVDLYFVTAGFNSGVKKEHETVKTGFSNVLQFDLGYDLLDNDVVSIYPYAGLGFRWSWIKYERRGEPNPAYISIVNIRTNGNNVSLESYRLGYQYGLGFDFRIVRGKSQVDKTIFFIKAGANRPVWKDSYHEKGVPNYKPDIKQGDWMISFGLKFASRG